jgi:hypothetical protein
VRILVVDPQKKRSSRSPLRASSHFSAASVQSGALRSTRSRFFSFDFISSSNVRNPCCTPTSPCSTGVRRKTPLLTNAAVSMRARDKTSASVSTLAGISSRFVGPAPHSSGGLPDNKLEIDGPVSGAHDHALSNMIASRANASRFGLVGRA